MIPVIPILVAALAIVRRMNGPAQSSTRGRDVGWLFIVKFLFALPLWSLALVGLQSLFGKGVMVGPSILGSLAVLMFVVTPVPLLRLTTVRLGLPRVTYYVARITGAFSRSGHFRSGATLLAAEALVRSRAPSPEDLAWVETRAERAPHRATNAVTLMTLRHVRGATDPDAARQAFELSCLIERTHYGDLFRLGRRRAFDFMLAEACRRGDYGRAARVRLSLARFSPRSWAVRVVARSCAGVPMTAQAIQRALAWPWVGSEGRALLRRRTDAPPETKSESDDRLAVAARAHARFLSSGTVRAANRALAAWDDALASTDVRAAWERRKAALGARQADLASVIDRARREIVEALLAHDLTEDETRAIASEPVRLGLKDALWERLNDATVALRKRTDDDDPLSFLEEWADIARIVALWERLLPLAQARELYEQFSYPLDHYACWTADKRLLFVDRPLSYAIFSFLRDQARAAGADADAARLEQNMKLVTVG